MKKLIIGLALALSSTYVSNYSVVFSPHDLACMTANIFFEARGEKKAGMEAVAKVTMNRVYARGYPPSVCSVVFQKRQFSWTHEQSWKAIWNVLNGDLRGFNKKDKEAYQLARDTAKKALTGTIVTPVPDDALWYHSTKVKPVWTRKLQKLGAIGKHIFYKEK